ANARPSGESATEIVEPADPGYALLLQSMSGLPWPAASSGASIKQETKVFLIKRRLICDRYRIGGPSQQVCLPIKPLKADAVLADAQHIWQRPVCNGRPAYGLIRGTSGEPNEPDLHWG